MKESKLISVVMPAYNCERFVRLAIDSILAQSYTYFELLIADDCSTDATRSIIGSYSDSRIKTFHNTANMGYLKACNKLLKLSQGDYITFQDADDYCDPDRLKKLSEVLDTNPGISCIGSNISKVSPEGEFFFNSNFPLHDEEIRVAFLNYRVVFTGAALMVKKELVEKIGIYNEYFNRIGSEDIYWYSFILDHFKVANLPEALYYYRSNPNSVTSTHKNPKAFVGHQLIIHLYKNRLKKRTDYIASGQWKKADDCAAYLLAVNAVKKSRVKGCALYFRAFLKAPLLSAEFTREFLAHLRQRF